MFTTISYVLTALGSAGLTWLLLSKWVYNRVDFLETKLRVREEQLTVTKEREKDLALLAKMRGVTIKELVKRNAVLIEKLPAKDVADELNRAAGWVPDTNTG